MNKLNRLQTIVYVVSLVIGVQALALAQSTDDKNKLATMNGSGSMIRWNVVAPHSEVTLTVSAPDGQVFRKVFRSGGSVEFTTTDLKGERLPDGQYTYELRLTPVFSADVKETLAAARAKGNDEEVARDLRKRGVLPSQPLVQSGGFAILNGSVVVSGALEEGTSRRVASGLKPRVFQPANFRPATRAAMGGFRSHHAPVNPFFDFVIADDLIVQGSACVGLDCVDGENFGFDTIRVKENNTRIQFDDTSTSAGFATNNWQIRANAQASGGASFLAFVDQGATGNSETGTIVFEVDAGAPANSLRVSSGGNIGIGTATPVLDVHANTTDTPAIRLEQNNSGGFTAQTWDIAGNEANFFVRDVTSGSRLPFRIRPGAPTSSIDIGATGNVGIGQAATSARIAIDGTAGVTGIDLSTDDLYADLRVIRNTLNASDKDLYLQFLAGAGSKLHLYSNNSETMTLTGGQVGIGTTAPTDTLSVNGTASKSGGGSWSVFSDERLKLIKGGFNRGLNAVMQLQPLRYEYKSDNPLSIKSNVEHIGFGAQSVQKVIPEAVTTSSAGYLQINNDPILWTMLNAIKEQQKEIEKLKTEVRRLRATSRRRR